MLGKILDWEKSIAIIQTLIVLLTSLYTTKLKTLSWQLDLLVMMEIEVALKKMIAQVDIRMPLMRF